MAYTRGQARAGAHTFAPATQAGSEKWRTHQLAAFSDRRIQEMTSINKSLSTLGNCVRALGEPGRKHIPYRDSKLTRLLADALGGNCKTAFVVTLSPAECSLEETVSTLKFADRAKVGAARPRAHARTHARTRQHARAHTSASSCTLR